MSLAAFTNEPGTHVKYEHAVGSQTGIYYGNHNVDEIIYDYLYNDQVAIKQHPTQGFGRCTYWYRNIRKVTSNTPARRHRFASIGGGDSYEVVIDLKIDHHICPLDHNTGDYIPPNPGLDNSISKSITSALNRLTDKYVGIGNDLAEARKTCTSFASLAGKAAKFLLAVKRGQWELAMQHLGGSTDLRTYEKNLANLWLAYVYGWKPLAADLHEAQELAHAALEKAVPIRATDSDKSEYTDHFVYAGFMDVTSASAGSARTELRAHVTNPMLHNLSQAGLINPLSIAWELVPFSFVIDWFVPVGQTLQAITAGVGLESDGGFTSIQVQDSLDIHLLTQAENPALDYSEGGHYRNEGFVFRRYCYASFPSPQLYADVTPYSSERAVNALALLRQLT